MTKKRQRGEAGAPVYEESAEERFKGTMDFIKGLQFTNSLKALQGQERRECPKCKKKRLYYCYDCIAVCAPESHPPPVALPITVNVIFHPGEHRSKSTSVAAATISPDIRILEYPTVPEELDPESTLLLYPSPTSVGLDELPNLNSYKNVVFVDSTWQQSKKIVRDDRVTRFKHVRIKAQTSLFWRFQNNDPSYLATVEAIYYFLKEYVTKCNEVKQLPPPHYRGEVDDILYYYINQYVMVQRNYSQQKQTKAKPQDDDGEESQVAGGKKFTTRHFGGYVLEGASWDELLK